ncbi:serine hydrolase [Sungkyunkwania multivorans]|uniref:Serine hydrolase n=1 Tax=Sungkyunkwania multivorans TaxID=1173618 RepID=A0ABW3CVF7_9FLAO
MKYPALLLLLILISCSEDRPFDLNVILGSDHPKIKKVMADPEAHEVQVIVSEILKEDEDVIFIDHHFQVNDSNYFYPASTVKFPVAVLAMEKLCKDRIYDSHTSFFVEGDTTLTTMAKEVSKIFAVSDNLAYNRLFEYLGTDHINSNLKAKGLHPVRISHRLSTKDADDVTTKVLIFEENDSVLTHTHSTINKEPERLQLNGMLKGKGYYEDGDLVQEPFDFSEKNYLPLTTLHNCMKRLIFPQAFEAEEQFELKEEDRLLLLASMKTVPRTLGYDASEYYDGYGKFLIIGDSTAPLPSHLEIYNKVGYAYGYLTDCAYIVDTKTNTEFIITATVHVNENEIFNDDHYEYDTVGIPFLAELGRQVHQQLSSED